MQLTRTVH